jgi:diguanylate cyclase (GGDEF)-like protein/PAS domain S-box-containing protein
VGLTGSDSLADRTPALGSARTLLEAWPDPAWLFDRATRRIVGINPLACRLLGVKAETLLGTPADGVLSTPEDLAWWAVYDPQQADVLDSEVPLVSADGRIRPMLRTIRPVAGSTWGLVCLRDLSALRHAEEEREGLVTELRATLEAAGDGLLVTDRDGRVRACNRRLAELWRMPSSLFERLDAHALIDWIRGSIEDPLAWQARLEALQRAPLLVACDRLVTHDGRIIDCVARPMLQRGRPFGRVFSFHDLTDALSAERRVAEVASTDQLTGLPNRRRLADAVAERTRENRAQARGFALLVVDLDHFRHVNDTLGHEVGDRVLLDVAQRVRSALREQDLIARVGGDEFALLIDGADSAAAESAARRVLAVVAQPCEIEGEAFTVTCSIGVALFPDNGATLDTLSTHAEAAMRLAKEGGRADFRLHQPKAPVNLKRQMALDHAMRQALVSGRFRLHYQPQIELEGGRLVGAEALIRWRDPEHGEVPPSQFIPVAEDTGFIVAIGDWVLSQAVRQASLWHERGTPVPIAINVSALQFQQVQFVDRVASVLAVSGLPPALLELELTESILVRDAEEALHRLQALASLGVRLSIDDFGTGYSSLAYLKRFPIDKLKIDRSFIKGLPGDESDAAIVRAMLQMAHALNLQVVAEGVETEPQRHFLRAAGCPMFQGYLFSPALDSMSFEKRLLSWPIDDGAARVRLVHG